MLRGILLLSSLVLIWASWLVICAFGVVEPVERNIIYIHVPAAICSLFCFGVLFVCSICYLWRRGRLWDSVGGSAGEAGFVFASVLNVTGMIFAHAEWGVWWTASPRLVSSAALWFLYLAYLVLRSSFESGGRRERLSAVFGIIGFLDVPIVLISARFMPDIHRGGFSFGTWGQSIGFGLTVLGTILLAGVLIWVRAEVEEREKQLEEMNYEEC